MKLRIGLVTHSFGWEQLCAQEGIAFEVLDLSSQRVANECSILVVNRELNRNERNIVEQYLRNGGAVIGFTQHLLHIGGTEGMEQQVKYIVAERDDIFPSIHLLDVGVQGLVPRSANALRTDTNTFAVAAGPLIGGHTVVLPFDVDMLMHDARPAGKSFYFKLDRLPSERVSLVDKGELRQLVHSAFTYLHHVRGIPYVHAWYFPKNRQNVFAMRIDSDGGTKEEVDALYRVGRDYSVGMSWFLDVRSHEQWLDHFKHFVGQEIGLHCYEHQTYPTFDANMKNISDGLQQMRRVGLAPSGFTAPFGIWNPGLAQAVDQAGLEYSSEFSYAYDSFPLFAETMGTRYNTLQIPIHPVCIGSMLRVGYSDVQMREYFAMVVRRKLFRNEPLFFYHHPSHRQCEVLRDLFSLIREHNIESMTMGEYARWWKRRISTFFTITLDGSILRVDGSASISDDVYLRIVDPKGQEAIVSASGSMDLKSGLPWITPAAAVRPPSDIRRIREFDSRQKLGELYDTLIRKLK